MGNLIVILGPTGVGKTGISLKLASLFQSQIISADSRQIFKEIAIGTAKPTPEQLQTARHHFISTHSITEHYSAGQYELDALPIIEQLTDQGETPILVGGSMLYVDAICKGIDDIPTITPEIRQYVTQMYEQEGLDSLRAQLKLLDPIHYHKVDPKNHKRIIHALEVCLQTGRPISEIHTGTAKKRSFNIIKIGLNLPREQLYQQINTRVDQMVEQGLRDEVWSVYPHRHLNALNTVGYKEYFAHFDGEYDEATAIEKIKRNTRIYAKKQLTWFGKDPDTKWFDPHNHDEIIDYVKSRLQP